MRYNFISFWLWKICFGYFIRTQKLKYQIPWTWSDAWKCLLPVIVWLPVSVTIDDVWTESSVPDIARSSTTTVRLPAILNPTFTTCSKQKINTNSNCKYIATTGVLFGGWTTTSVSSNTKTVYALSNTAQFHKALSRKYCLTKVFAKQKLSGAQSQQCKLHLVLASKLFLLSNTFLCLASFLYLQALWNWAHYGELNGTRCIVSKVLLVAILASTIATVTESRVNIRHLNFALEWGTARFL